MRKSSSGVGFIVLLIALAIVMVLAARNWQAIAPTAMEVTGADGPVAVDDHGQPEAAAELRNGGLPRLGEMEAETDEHSATLREALDATNQ